MRKVWKSLASVMLAVAMVLTTVMTYLPSMEVLAAPIMKNMAHLKSGSGNANGHFGSSNPEAFILSDNADATDGDFSFTLKVGSTQNDTRFRFVNKYVDDDNWSFIAYDGMSNNWFVQYAAGERYRGDLRKLWRRRTYSQCEQHDKRRVRNRSGY